MGFDGEKNGTEGLIDGWVRKWCQFLCIRVTSFSADLDIIWTFSRFVKQVMRFREKKDHRWVCQNWVGGLGLGFGIIWKKIFFTTSLENFRLGAIFCLT